MKESYISLLRVIKEKPYGLFFITYDDESLLSLFIETAKQGVREKGLWYEVKEIDEDIDEALHLCRECLFGGGSKIIIVNDVNITDKRQLQELERCFIKEQHIDTLLILLFDVSNKDEISQLKKWAKERSVLLHLTTPSKGELKSIINAKFKKEGLIIDNALETALTERAGNLIGILNEIEKIIIYSMGKKSIKLEDVEEILSMNIELKYYYIINAILQRNISDAISIFEKLTEYWADNRNEWQMLMGYIINYVKELLILKNYLSEGKSLNDIVEMTGKKSWLIEKTSGLIRNISVEVLKEWLKILEEYDMRLKYLRIKNIVLFDEMVMKMAGNNSFT